MAIMGGAIVPKLMGYVADQYDMSRGFSRPQMSATIRIILSYPSLRRKPHREPGIVDSDRVPSDNESVCSVGGVRRFNTSRRSRCTEK